MLLSLYEIQSANQNCPSLLTTLLEKCNIDYDLSRIEENRYSGVLSDKIDAFIVENLKSEDILDALGKLLRVVGIEKINSLSLTEMVDKILENEEKILKHF